MKKILVSVLFAGLSIAMCAAADKPADKKGAGKSAANSSAGAMDAWVSDKTCGANVSAACAKKCAEGGIPLVIVKSADKSVIPVSNQDTLKPFIGQHVTITGTMQDGSFVVATIKPVKEPSKK